MDTAERNEEATSSDASDEEQPGHASVEPANEDDARSSASSPSFSILTTRQFEQWMTLNNQIDVGSAGNVVWTVSSAKHGSGVRHLLHWHDVNTFWQSDGVLPHVIRIRLSQLTPVEALAVYVNSAVDQSYSPRVIQVKAGTHAGDMTEVAKADIGAGQECGWVLMELADHAEDSHDPDSGQTAKGRKKARTVTSSNAGKDDEEGNDSDDKKRFFSYSEVAAVVGHHHPAPLHSPPCPTTGGTATAVGPSPPSPAPSPLPFVEVTRTPADRWLWCTMIDICICENQFNGRDCHLRGICLTGPRYEVLEQGQVEDDLAAGTFERGVAATVKSLVSGSGGGTCRADQPINGEVCGRRIQQDWQLR
jgi:anaphase-promoting complex subunit 10